MMKSWRLRFLNIAVLTTRVRNACRISFGEIEGRDHLEDVGVGNYIKYVYLKETGTEAMK
jgi:hypothetical protein